MPGEGVERGVGEGGSTQELLYSREEFLISILKRMEGN
jgi:hypothetical protein